MSAQKRIKEYWPSARATENDSEAPTDAAPPVATPPVTAPEVITAAVTAVTADVAYTTDLATTGTATDTTVDVTADTTTVDVTPPDATPPDAITEDVTIEDAITEDVTIENATTEDTTTADTEVADSEPATRKRAASPIAQAEAARKRSRANDDPSGDDPAPALRADKVAHAEPGVLNGRPIVWAKTRSDLCDSQKLYRAYNSGAHTKDKKILSLYINKFSEPRDFLGRAKLVTCASQGKDHPEFANLNLPTDVRKDGAFVELATFMVTKVWKEMVQPETVQKPYQVWKIMLQTMDPTSKPWYWKDDTLNDTTTEDSHITDEENAHDSIDTQATTNYVEKRACTNCEKVGPRIFENAPWVCLEDNCDEFFQVDGKVLSQIGDDSKELRYSEDFINQTTPYDDMQDIPTLFQPLPKDLVEGGDLYGTEEASRGGMTCPDCGCCTSRKYWDRLECCNCFFQNNAFPLHYPLDKVESETTAQTKKLTKKNNGGLRKDGLTMRMDKHHVDLFTEIDDDKMSTRFIYMIKHADGELIGTFVVERPSNDAKKAPGGADEIYKCIEAEDSNMRFQRNPARCPGSTSETLTRHFQSNFGALYDFGVRNIDTVPFKNAPVVVLKSLAYLKHFGEKALESSQAIASREDYELAENSTLLKPTQTFNELLALAYRESDKINWHDDGEDQLSGVISTASFGSPGLMALRFKGKRTKKNATKFDEEKKGKVILEVQLRHGDVATMCDTRLQAFTDHMVEPDGIRRYAMTSRTINFDHYREQKQRAKLVQRGLTIETMEEAAELPDSAKDFAYNGTSLCAEQTETEKTEQTEAV
ncbi:hypothetical protein Daus18300_014393 [Diaporthe australafricana]|uniref:Alpha-ketoglutarate-dependent dioxygenase AlkB-like domain-containing protein n=1 Tax=Diaporthe australafricana TaxID=127596 RepID=A0ABR3VVH2_9PEZI